MPHPSTDTKVMVVSDCMTTLKSIFDYLEKMNVQPLLADNGNDAINIFCREYPDIVLLDDSIPDMDAATVAGKIRAIERNKDWTAIIFLTSMNSEDDLANLLNNGNDFYLIKPISEFVLKTIKRLLTMQSIRIDLNCSINYAKHMLSQITESKKSSAKANSEQKKGIPLHN